jgi:hypothetical protein
MDNLTILTGTLNGDINKTFSMDLSGLVSGSIDGPVRIEIKLIPVSGEPLFGEITTD